MFLCLLEECEFATSCAPAPAVSHQSDVLASQYSYDAPVATATILLQLTCKVACLGTIENDLPSIKHGGYLVA